MQPSCPIQHHWKILAGDPGSPSTLEWRVSRYDSTFLAQMTPPSSLSTFSVWSPGSPTLCIFLLPFWLLILSLQFLLTSKCSSTLEFSLRVSLLSILLPLQITDSPMAVNTINVLKISKFASSLAWTPLLNSILQDLTANLTSLLISLIGISNLTCPA